MVKDGSSHARKPSRINNKKRMNHQHNEEGFGAKINRLGLGSVLSSTSQFPFAAHGTTSEINIPTTFLKVKKISI